LKVQAKHTLPCEASQSESVGLTPLNEILAAELAWLRGLEIEALDQAEVYGPIQGAVRPAQRCWSQFLDQVEHERQECLA
jgi:hypothetical protein